ncbi:relaxase/mobilization nuclease domain-containing protein [Persicitalea sp.]|uniref:relaxase/mobilization nuclease domain-containing protein n=1 Tax=Persicitalea sp. TaxID=3100273 RepID=UPI0035932BBA
MIGKIGKSGQNFLGVLSYCKYDRAALRKNEAIKVRGELIYYQHINALLFGEKVPLNIIADELKSVAASNSRTQKPVCHVSISFPPGESPDKGTLRGIVTDFAEDFGFRENGLLAFKHTDKEHEHIHIIANKIASNGKNTAKSSYNYLEMGRFCRKMEIKYDLRQVKQMDSLKLEEAFAPRMTTHHERLRRNIDDLIPECNNLHTLQIKLLKMGFKSKVGNGVAFICKKTGTQIKASSLGRQYSKTNLIHRINGEYKSEGEVQYSEKVIKDASVKDSQLEKRLSPKVR